MIAQLVERRTVVGFAEILRSLVRIRLEGQLFFFLQGLVYPFFELQKIVPRVRLELTTFRSLLPLIHYETDALPTALPRQLPQQHHLFAQIKVFDIANNHMIGAEAIDQVGAVV